MKTIVTLCLACTLSLAALGQNTATKRTDRPAASKTITIIGRVSDDRMFLRDNDDQDWSVANPSAFKGYENSAVTVKCHLDPAQTIHIVSVTNREATYSARRGDSAFRR